MPRDKYSMYLKLRFSTRNVSHFTIFHVEYWIEYTDPDIIPFCSMFINVFRINHMALRLHPFVQQSSKNVV